MTAAMTQAQFAGPAAGTVVTTASDREIVITRGFDAPRRLVWRTLTEPELVKRWMFGPSGWSFTTCEIDLRVGGRYRYEWRNEDGRTMGLGGVYREIARPERLVNTERFDGEHDSGETLVTTALAEWAERTTLTMTLLYESRQARDEAIESNMAEGLDMSFQRVDAVLAELLAAER
jgi:uncharacterized protein YndB with AHSA1/START domain